MKNIKFLLVLGIIVSFATGYIVSTQENVAVGATIQGNDYQATTTAASNAFGSRTTGGLLKTGYGSLGTVTITGANTGVVNFYDATTTDITKRNDNKATSSILIASLPASLAAGDYPFDIALSTGLYVDLFSGNMPTSTISYR